MKRWLAVPLACWLAAGAAEESLPPPGQTVPMPPKFTVNADREDALRNYPLGKINRLAAFTHHGEPHRTVTLPNGLEGWVYEVGRSGREETFRQPSGESRSVETRPSAMGTRTYTLEFDERGVVIDVLYNEQGPHDGLTALQLQRHAGGDRARPRWIPGKSD